MLGLVSKRAVRLFFPFSRIIFQAFSFRDLGKRHGQI